MGNRLNRAAFEDDCLLRQILETYAAMKLTTKILTVGVCALFSISTGSRAADDLENKSSKLFDSLMQCRPIADPAKRVACYDSATERLASARADKSIVVVDRADVKEAKRGLFGFAQPVLKIFSGDDDPKDAEIVANIKGVKALASGTWRFRLEDGALWETTEAHSGMTDPTVGATVVLSKGVAGSYFAKIGKGRAVRAKRVG